MEPSILGGSAYEAGLIPIRRDDQGDIVLGDLIIAIDGKPVKSVDAFLNELDNHAVGDKVKLTILRAPRSSAEETLEVTVRLHGTE